MKQLSKFFYQREDVLLIAKELLGKVITTHFDGLYTSGRIVEAEAYMHFEDEASHARRGTRTSRNEHMYATGGTLYVYICYGMHHMVNIVTNKTGIPDAILIRAIEPISGEKIMAERTGKKQGERSITRGPGNVAKALGINKIHSGNSFYESENLYVTDEGIRVNDEDIIISPRIGVEGAGADALLPYRFFLKGNKYVSVKTNYA